MNFVYLQIYQTFPNILVYQIQNGEDVRNPFLSC